MRKTLWTVFSVWLIGMSLQAAVTYDFTEGGSQTGGYYLWSDSGNWESDGLPVTSVPTTTDDNARFRGSARKVLVDTSIDLNILNIQDGGTHEFSGAASASVGRLVLNNTGSSMALYDSDFTVTGRLQVSDITSANLSLYGSSHLISQIRFDNTSSVNFQVDLNDSAVLEGFNVLSFIEEGDCSGSKITVNDNSQLLLTGTSAAELDVDWFERGMTIDLNDEASITLATYNGTRYAAYIDNGYLNINGKGTDAVENVDYVIDSDNYTITAIPEPVTVGLFGVSSVLLLVCRRALR